MVNYVAGQLAALGAAVALGAAGGLVYDLLRVLRRRRPGLTHAADAVFGLMCLLGTLWALTRVGGGEPQLYLLLGAGAGMLLYLLAAAAAPVGILGRCGRRAGAAFAAAPGFLPPSGKKIAAGSKKGLPFCGKVRYTKHILVEVFSTAKR